MTPQMTWRCLSWHDGYMCIFFLVLRSVPCYGETARLDSHSLTDYDLAWSNASDWVSVNALPF